MDCFQCKHDVLSSWYGLGWHSLQTGQRLQITTRGTAASAPVSTLHHHPLPSSRAFLIWLLKSQCSLLCLVPQQQLLKAVSSTTPTLVPLKTTTDSDCMLIIRTGTQSEAGFINALAILTSRRPVLSTSSSHTPSHNGLSILAVTSLSLRAGIRMVSSNVTRAFTITGSGEEPCRAIATPRLANRRFLFPFSSVQLWDSKNQLRGWPQPSMHADATTIRVWSPAISTITEPQTSSAFPATSTNGLPSHGVSNFPPEAVCPTYPYEAELLLLQYQ